MSTTDYTKSAAFKLNPTHCSVCNRPLVDGTSVEAGIGPVCRGKYGYEDAYPIDNETAKDLVDILKGMDTGKVADDTIDAVLNDDSRKAVNVLNHAVAVWAHEGTNEADMTLALEAMKRMGYTALVKKVAGRLADVTVEVEDGRVILDTPFDEAFLSAVKQINGRRWDKDRKVWTVPVGKKVEAWKAMQKCYKGMTGYGPQGMFTI